MLCAEAGPCLSLERGHFSSWFVPGYRQKSPDNGDLSLINSDPVAALCLLIGNPIPQSRARCFLGSSPRRLGASSFLI